MSNERDTGDAIVSFLVGAGIGAATAAIAALLYAPKPGMESRRDITQGAQELWRRADNIAKQVQGTAGDVAARLRQDLDSAMSAGKEAAAARETELKQKVRSE